MNRQRVSTILEEISSLPRHLNSPSLDYSAKVLADAYSLETIILTQDDEVNGWVIPPKYHVIKAYIADMDGNIVYNGLDSSLAVISYSSPINRIIDRDVLLEHCFTDIRYPDAIPYHFRQSYRPWDRTWGFCMTEKDKEKLVEDRYEIVIETEEGECELKVLRGRIQGKSDLTFTLCAHLDHPGLVNDDLTGVMVCCELFEKLSSLSLNYSIEILIVPEIIGSELYLNKYGQPFQGLFIESVGRKDEFKLQQSLCGNTIFEKIFQQNFADIVSIVPYRTVYGNDEGNFESYSCPMASLTRGIFHGYHSSFDSLSAIEVSSLESCVELLEKVLILLQDEIMIEKHFRGNICLSNPAYNLYIDPGQPAFENVSDLTYLRKIMDTLPSLPKFYPLKELCLSCDCSIGEALDYLLLWQQKNLLTLHGSEVNV